MIPYFFSFALINIIAGITSPLLAFPDVTLPPDTAAAIASAVNNLLLIKNVVPLTLAALFAAIIGIIGVETKIFSYKTVRWIYSKIPGVN